MAAYKLAALPSSGAVSQLLETLCAEETCSFPPTVRSCHSCSTELEPLPRAVTGGASHLLETQSAPSTPRSRTADLGVCESPLSMCRSKDDGVCREALKSLSIASTEVAKKLDSIAECLSQMHLKCDEADAILGEVTDGMQIPIGLRNALSQLHGSADQLLAMHLDAIITSDLNSGKTNARTRRRVMIQRTEALIERVEMQVKKIDKFQASSVACVRGRSVACHKPHAAVLGAAANLTYKQLFSGCSLSGLRGAVAMKEGDDRADQCFREQQIRSAKIRVFED
mmetsp:Transcript_73335/g.122485  ORF Transcript_73335/g.122485 Transcript_73335/m.122485 type:complete len:283 (+) Transcript_73335:35-883(+)|eukprot:CAMPEP_0119331520 /NCGR_PEP_ID=MMETSP1333-20130426/80722_1 /TAXON_ID=418940 /ORGANISM="Scyphosphaera apsteinii, Strain RCC1455" /LENGTH=282 /DNA_ID=CAMNT_0007341139 /DNA_START=34 /DNA_END=882 /DNA_ORIENTATION=-